VIRLSAFADEISPDINKQIAVLHDRNIHWLDLRSVDGINVLDLSDEQVLSITRALRSSGIGVASIGSPLGKVPIDRPIAEQNARFDRAVQLAHDFGTPFIRIFSFYPPAGADVTPATYRDEAISRLRLMTDRARGEDIILLHENDIDLYGDTVERCRDVLQAVADPHLRAVFDPANFILAGEQPYPAAYDVLRPWIMGVHVKDALPGGRVVPAGEGIADWPAILRHLEEDGYDGFLALEPHLADAGRFSGFSGPDRFLTATQALTKLLDEQGWEYS
jgi:sugar phosphate isomerase/epimerase